MIPSNKQPYEDGCFDLKSMFNIKCIKCSEETILPREAATAPSRAKHRLTFINVKLIVSSTCFTIDKIPVLYETISH